MVRLVGLVAGLLFASVISAQEKAPWPAQVEGWKKPEPGEHPRLFFRKSDLPELRKRAETPEGKKIVARLKELLGGGEEMPKFFNTAGKAYDKGDGKEPKEMPVGTYTMAHAAGFGFLYQLTGDKKYAELGRKCFEKAWEGVRDRDDRYGWTKPGGALRAGPSLGIYAIGYDLCYDGWDDDFRKKVALEIQNYNQGQFMTLDELAQGKRHHPGSNHWGPQVGGGALALLAINGDPGVDQKKIDKLLEANAKAMIRHVTDGFGDHGFFAEGDGPGTIASDTAYVPALQAWKIAGGKDFITPRPNAQWLTLKWVMQTLPTLEGKPAFPKRGGYEHNVYSRTGMSGSGTFAQGFGAIPDDFKPALLWTYNHCVSPKEAEYDLVNLYPHRAVLAFINWPFHLKEENPGKVMPKAVGDSTRAYYMFRNQWEGPDDILVTALFKNSKGFGSVPGGDILVWGLGKKTKFPVKVTGNPTAFHTHPDGGVVEMKGLSFGVDFSGKSGAPALLVLAGNVTGKVSGAHLLKTPEQTFTVMTLQKGEGPMPRVEDNAIRVGEQTIRWDGTKLVFGK